METTLKTGDLVIWTGVADRLIGRIETISPWGKSNVRRIDGTVCTVDVDRLSLCDPDLVLWATLRGGCTVPKEDTMT